MPRNLRRFSLVVCLALAACATQPEFGAQDETAITPLLKSYYACLNHQAVEMVNGSDDVTLITRVVMRSCTDGLQPIGEYLHGRGFADTFVSRYLSNTHQRAGDAVEALVLRMKSSHSTAAPL